jgi:hypothetical protein
MTILNHPSDGLHPELIVLARAVALEGSIDQDTLVKVCTVAGGTTRVSGALSRWSRLGLFRRDGEMIQLSEPFIRKRGQSIDDWTEGLPSACRKLALEADNCLPLWGDEQGPSADFAKGIAWMLAQDIFQLPRAWNDGIQLLENAQVKGEKIMQNDTRLVSLRFWARYCGFATGDSRSFFMDPTMAIRSALSELPGESGTFDAKTFVAELANLLPVLDGGEYRKLVEERLNSVVWRAPPAKHLSMSLSFALRRLDAEKVIALEGKADAEDAYSLTGMGYRTISRFTQVRVGRTKR